MKKHFTDEIAGEATSYLAVKAVVSTKQLCFKNFFYVAYFHVLSPSAALSGKSLNSGKTPVFCYLSKGFTLCIYRLFSMLRAIEHYAYLVNNHCNVTWRRRHFQNTSNSTSKMLSRRQGRGDAGILRIKKPRQSTLGYGMGIVLDLRSSAVLYTRLNSGKWAVAIPV